ncbi:ribonuclease H-like domain-containing protein [Pedococcus sp. P5_B7]
MSKHLPLPQWYLLALEFPEQVVFLDIETTGLSRRYHNLTIIGWGVDGEWKYEALGRDIRPSETFLDVLSTHPIVVTFNGSLFDLPFLRSTVSLPDLVSVDLRFLARRTGFGGSLKDVETRLGIRRPKALREIRGESAPGLWQSACRGDTAAMRRLLTYNYYDVRGLALLLGKTSRIALAQDELLSSTPSELILGAAQAVAAIVPQLDRSLISQKNLRSVVSNFKSDAMPVIVRADRAYDPGPVMGIDLTGSERRASGIAIIRDGQVDTCLASTDEEILGIVHGSGTKLVSIDAPLSLPFGRIVVTDDDPGRDEFGIMRWAERELKRRGVNVYPALLPSMQQLTRRGINLASQIRQLGIPCIESFPGAAQDILAMPRKQVGLKYLHESLESIGWHLTTKDPNHDELDAVTSALVGLFFLDGRYEALGTVREEPMIIPDLNRATDTYHSGVIISGKIAAGKTSLGRAIAEAGFTYGVYSEVVADECRNRGLGTGRNVMQQIGLEMHRELGQRELGRRLLEKSPVAAPVAIDGARWLEDIAYMREQTAGNLIHVHMNTDREERRKRFAVRGGTDEEFERADSHQVEGEIEQLEALADYRLNNSGDYDRLSKEVEHILRLFESMMDRRSIFITISPDKLRG